MLILLSSVAAGGCVRSGTDAGLAGSIDCVRADVARRAGVDVGTPVPSPDAACPDPVVAALLAQPLTQEAAVKVALLNNRTVRESYERLGIARADLLQAGLLQNPVFSADAKFFSGGPEIELGIAQSFLDLFFIPLRKRVAQADLCAEEAAVARDLVRLVYDVRRAFVTVWAGEAMVAMRKEAATTASASRDLMRKLHGAGNARDTLLTIEEVNAARAQLDLTAAEALSRDAREPLVVLLGLSGGRVEFTVAGRLEHPPAREDFPDPAARALAASLDLLENHARIRSAMYRAGLVRKEAWPVLDFGAVGKREGGAGGAWGFGPQVSTSLPIFDQGQARFLAASAALRQRVARHTQLAVEVESAARRLVARLTSLRERAEYLRDTYLPLRERLVKEVLEFFNAMQLGAFDVLNAKQQEMDARREYIETTRDAWIVRLDLRELLAGSLNPSRLEALSFPDEAEHPEPPKGH
jgi:cobalt-zinc-cadmium efflux system outer membrane protein